MCFLPQDAAARDFAIRQFEHFIAVEGQTLIGWRDVPTDLTGLGERVLETMPVIRQAIVAASPTHQGPGRVRAQAPGDPQADPEQIRGIGEQRHLPGLSELYMPSFSTRTVVYKGLLLAPQVGALLPGPAQSADRVGAGAGAPALLHQHLPVVEAGAPVPVPRPQRRDQHPARQRQLDERAAALDGVGAARAGSRQDVAAHSARPVRHRLPRQRARAADRRRLFAGARDDDADPGGLGRQSADGAEAARRSTNTTPR